MLLKMVAGVLVLKLEKLAGKLNKIVLLHIRSKSEFQNLSNALVDEQDLALGLTGKVFFADSIKVCGIHFRLLKISSVNAVP